MTGHTLTEQQAQMLQSHPASPASVTFQSLAEQPERLGLALAAAPHVEPVAVALHVWRQAADDHDAALLEHAEAWEAFLSAPARHAAAVDAAARGVAEVPTAPDLPALSVAAEVARARVGHAHMATRRAARVVDAAVLEHGHAIVEAVRPDFAALCGAWRSAWQAFLASREALGSAVSLWRDAEVAAALSHSPSNAHGARTWESAVFAAVRDVDRKAGLGQQTLMPRDFDTFAHEFAGLGVDGPPSILRETVATGRAAGLSGVAARLAEALQGSGGVA